MRKSGFCGTTIYKGEAATLIENIQSEEMLMKRIKILLTTLFLSVCALGFSVGCGEVAASESGESSFLKDDSRESSSVDLESMEETVSSEEIESSEESLESIEETVSNEEIESSEESLESIEETVSNEEMESSEESAESMDETVSSEEMESSEESAESMDEAVSSEEIESSEESLESIEETVSSEEIESSEEVETPTGVLEGEAPVGTRYKLGDVMYDFTVTTSDGGTFTLSEVLQEKELVVINFWATWCPPCKAEFPAMNAVLLEYGDSVDCIAISVSDSNAAVQAFKNENGYSFKMAAVGAGNNLEDFFGVYAIPHTVMVDRYGVIVFNETGARTDTAFWRNTFEKFIGEDY